MYVKRGIATSEIISFQCELCYHSMIMSLINCVNQGIKIPMATTHYPQQLHLTNWQKGPQTTAAAAQWGNFFPEGALIIREILI